MPKLKLLLTILTLSLSVIFFAANAFAAVTRNVPADYATIQAAVDAAASGDTIQVAAGTYNVTSTIDISGKVLTIQSASGAATTFVTGDGNESIFTFNDNSGGSTINGFTISGMGTTGGNDCGIRVSGGTGTGLNSMTFTNNIIYGTDSVNQNGIGVTYGTGHTITSNRIYNVGNGIVFGTTAVEVGATIQKNTIYSCSNNGIAIAVATGTITTYNNILKDNVTAFLVSATTGTISSNFNCLHGNTTPYSPVTIAGAYDITTLNPLLVSASSANFNLYSTSPCINAGTANGTSADGTTEIGWYQGSGDSGGPLSTSTFYVSGTGSDTTGNGSQAAPYRSVTKAVSYAATSATINILSGSYTTANSEVFPLFLPAGTTVQGAGASSSEIQGDSSESVFLLGGTNTTINDLKMKVSAANKRAIDNTASTYGLTVNDCIMYGVNQDSSIGVISGGATTINNCVFYSMDVGVTTYGAGGIINVYNCVAYNIVISSYGVAFGTAAGGTINVKNSIMQGCTNGIAIALAAGTLTSDYNCFYSNTTDVDSNVNTNGTRGAHSITSNPLFISASTYDFHLQTKKLGYANDSPCLDVGTSSGAPSADLEGVTRPQGSGVDIGAYELTSGYLATLNKDANKEKAAVGEVVTYTLTIKNTTGQNMLNTKISDTLPQGFKYLTNSAKLNNSAISNPTGARTRTFTLGTLSAGTTYTLKYKTVIGSGVGYGKSTNTAYLVASAALSSTAEETVLIVPNPIFNAATIIGKVYQDLNKNGYPDENEPGLEDIALLTEDGFMVITDEYGRYHLDGLKPQTKVIALDTKTLPKGAKLTTENPVLLRLTPALMMKANFGVYIEEEKK